MEIPYTTILNHIKPSRNAVLKHIESYFLLTPYSGPLQLFTVSSGGEGGCATWLLTSIFVSGTGPLAPGAGPLA